MPESPAADDDARTDAVPTDDPHTRVTARGIETQTPTAEPAKGELRRRGWYAAIFLAVFAFYMATSSREPAWGDAHGMWEVADQLVAHQRIDIKTHWPEDIPAGRNGLYYGIAPIGPSLAHVPGVLVEHAAHAIAPSQDPLFRPIATHLGPALLGALAAALFFGLLLDLKVRPRIASLSTAVLAVATTTWVYARMPYSEILQLACFLGYFRQVLRTAAAPSRRNAIWLGVWAGLLLDAKYVFAIAIAGGALLVLATIRRDRAALKRVVLAAGAAGAPFVVLALAYNYFRWDSIARTGYEPYLDAFFGGSVFDGAWGMLASPNKSAFLYSPPLVVALLAMPLAIRRHPRFGWALLLVAAPVFVTYCTYRSWSGDYAWGPRFFVWATPVVLVPFAFALERARRLGRIAIAAVVAVGIVVQLLGCALYWDHFIRLAIDTKNQWLGKPNRAGSYIAEKGRGHCDSCFEDTYHLLWTPAFQPIRGHWWLVKSIARSDTPVSAQDDAPWRGYTHLTVDLSQNFGRARIDWWGLLFLKDAPATFAAGLTLLIVFVGALAFGVWRWLRMHRGAS